MDPQCACGEYWPGEGHPSECPIAQEFARLRTALAAAEAEIEKRERQLVWLATGDVVSAQRAVRMWRRHESKPKLIEHDGTDAGLLDAIEKAMEGE